MAGQKGMRPAPESLGDHPAGRGTGIRNRGGTVMPMVPPLSYRPPKAAVQGVLMRERRQPPPPADAFMLCAHQMAPSPHGRARRGDGEERQIERGGPALRLGDDGRREQREANDGVNGFSDGLHGGLLFPDARLMRPGVAAPACRRRSGVQPRFRRLEMTLARNVGALRPFADGQPFAADDDPRRPVLRLLLAGVPTARSGDQPAYSLPEMTLIGMPVCSAHP